MQALKVDLTQNFTKPPFFMGIFRPGVVAGAHLTLQLDNKILCISFGKSRKPHELHSFLCDLIPFCIFLSLYLLPALSMTELIFKIELFSPAELRDYFYIAQWTSWQHLATFLHQILISRLWL